MKRKRKENMMYPPHHDDFDGSNIPDMAERRLREGGAANSTSAAGW